MSAHGIATIYTLRRFYMIMRRTTTLNPEPYNFYFLSISLHKRYNNLNMHTKRNTFV